MSEKSFLHIRCKRPSTNERGRRRRSNLRSQLMNNPLQTPSCHTDWIMDWPIDVITSGPAKTSPTERGKESPRCVWLPPGRVIPSFWTSSPPLPSSASPCSSPSTKSPIGELQMQTSRPADNSNLWPSPARRFLYNCPPVAAPHCVYICVMETHEYLYTWAAWEQRLTLCPIKYKYEGKYKYKYMNIYTGRPPENNVCIMPQQIQIQKPTCVLRTWHAWPKIWIKLKSLKRWARARAAQSDVFHNWKSFLWQLITIHSTILFKIFQLLLELANWHFSSGDSQVPKLNRERLETCFLQIPW